MPGGFSVPDKEFYPTIRVGEYVPIPYTRRHVTPKPSPYQMGFWQKIAVVSMMLALGLTVLAVGLALVVIIL